jgi:citrate lyase subunit beta/citryl-CoA lyase
MALLRSLLFTPGNNMRMIAKSGERHADAVILDLEDSVPMPDKETARLFVRDTLEEVAAGGSMVFVRINALGTGLSADDLDWIVRPGLGGIVLPKAESADDVASLSGQLDVLERQRDLKGGCVIIVPILETAKGIMNAYAVASASPRVAALALGGVDFSRDMGVELTKEGTELFYPRAHIAIAARAAEILAIDTPCIAARDSAQLAAESAAARQLGFRGKLLIHPSQVAPVNKAFSPPQADVAQARKIVAAFDEAQKLGQGAISLDGKMIDVANYRQAKDLIDAAEAVEEREKRGS